MSGRRIEELMRRPAPGEAESEARAYELARAAFEEREPPPPRRPPMRALAIMAAAVAVAVTLAITPAGGAIAGWIGEGLGFEVEGERPAAPALVALPSEGELLVVSERGPWVVHADGSKRLLGPYDDAAWSPDARFVVATQGRQVVALEPGTGDPRWSLARREPVRAPRWSPDPGFRVAYQSGAALRVVAGDGTGDHLLAPRVARTPPAWRPDTTAGGPDGGEQFVLAFADRRGRIVAADVDGRERLWRSGPGERPAQLTWSPDSERLVAVGERSLRVFSGDGRVLAEASFSAPVPQPALEGGRLAAFTRRGHEFALIRAGARPGLSEVVVLEAERRPGKPRQLFEGPGAFSELAWSPDGRWLLVGWPDANQWLFLQPRGSRRVKPVANLARQFSPSLRGQPAFPRIAGWCCPP